MQNNVNILNRWLKLNKLSLNVAKTKFMVFKSYQKKTCMTDFKLTIDSKDIEHVEAYKYLGVYLDTSLKFDAHADYVCSKICSFLPIIYHARKVLSKKVLRLILQAFVFPHVSYGLSVYGLTYNLHLKPIHVMLNRFVRLCCDIDLREPANRGYTELNIDNLETLIKIRLATLVYTALNNPHKNLYMLFLYPEPNIRNTRFVDDIKLIPTPVGTDISKRQINHVGAEIWNLLPAEVTDSANVGLFKKRSKYFIRHNPLTLSLPQSHLNK
jgi:hypothetical protein